MALAQCTMRNRQMDKHKCSKLSHISRGMKRVSDVYLHVKGDPAVCIIYPEKHPLPTLAPQIEFMYVRLFAQRR